MVNLNWKFGHWAVKDSNLLHHQNIIHKLILLISQLYFFEAYPKLFRSPSWPSIENKVLSNFVKISSYLHLHQEMVFNYFQIHVKFHLFIFELERSASKTMIFLLKLGHWAVNDSDFQCHQNKFFMLQVPCPIHKPFLCTFSRGEGSKCATWLGLTQQYPIIHLRNSWVIQNGKIYISHFVGSVTYPD